MNLENLRTLSRLTVPALKISRVTDPSLDLIINEVVKDVNARLLLLNQDEKFNVVADQYKYDLGEVLTRFSKIDNLGLYWNNGSASSTDWKKLEPKTVKYLDNNFPQWRDAESSDPMYYAKKGRYLYIYPTPDTALTDGFWLYFIQNPTPMSANSDYPFGGTSEIPEYSTLTDCILKGVEYWTLPIVGEKAEQVQAGILKEYLSMIEIKRRILNESPDISSEAKMKINHVC